MELLFKVFSLPKMEELSSADKYYHNHLMRMKEYYERNTEAISIRRRQKRVEKNPNVLGRGKFNPKLASSSGPHKSAGDTACSAAGTAS